MLLGFLHVLGQDSGGGLRIPFSHGGDEIALVLDAAGAQDWLGLGIDILRDGEVLEQALQE